MRAISTCLPVLLLAGSVASRPLPAQRPAAIEEVFPASSFGYIQFGGLDRCAEGARELGLVKLGAQMMERAGDEARTAYQEHLRELIQEVGPELARELSHVGMDPALLRGLLRRPLALGVGRPTFFGGVPVPSVTVAIDATGVEQEIAALIGRLQGLVGQLVGDVEAAEVDMAGTGVTVLQSARHSGSIAHARVGSFFLLSNSTGYLGECLATCRGERSSLAQCGGFKRGRSKLPAEPLLAKYLHVEPFLGMLAPLLPYECGDVFTALGAHDIDGVFVGATSTADGSVEVVHVDVAGPASGLLRSALGRPVSFRRTGLCPEDTLLFATASIDSAGVMRALQGVFDALPREAQRELEREVIRELRRELGHELRQLDMSLEQVERLARAFGPELTIAVTTPAGSSMLPELVVMVDVADPEAVAGLLQRVLGEIPELDVGETSFKGTPIRYSRAFRQSPVPYSPALALHDGQLILASSVSVLKSTLARAEGDRASLQQAEDFGARIAAARGASVFACMRLSSAVPHMWRLAEPWVAKGAMQIGLDPDAVPAREDLADAISDSVLSLTFDDTGLTGRSEQVLGLGAMIALSGSLLDEILAADPQAVRAHRAVPAPVPAKKPKPSIF